MVPVVYGGANYSKVAPDMSYIDVRDFKSVRQLADYLNYLDTNDDEYLRYFQWRPILEEISGPRLYAAYCSLCWMLHQNDPPLPAKSYEDIDSWWSILGQCGKDAALFRSLLVSSSSLSLVSHFYAVLLLPSVLFGAFVIH